MKNNLTKYIKQKDKTLEVRVTSINITLEQHAFLKNNKIELGPMVREFLNDLMDQTKKRGA